MNRRTQLLWALCCVGLMSVWVSAQTTNLLPMGGFESGKPSLYSAEQGAGAVLTWATDQMHSGTRSLKIAKASTGAASRWVSGNNVRYWVENIPKAVDIKIGAWVKTSGVNTSPATADAKWQVKFAFYDTNMVIIGAPVVLDVDQSVATRDWYADTNGVASLQLPKDAYKLIISAEAGANATGTVWFDDFIFIGRAGAWAGQNWNGFVDADSGWQYWIAPVGGNDGETYFPGSGVVDGVARTGTSSLKISAPAGHPSGELVWFTETVPVTAGKAYVLSSWVKTSQIRKDSVFNAESQLGYTVTWHSKAFSDGGGWNEFAGADYRFTLKDTATDWTQYSTIFTAPVGATHVSVRARSWHIWSGVSWWDDFALRGLEALTTGVEEQKLPPTASATPTEYALAQNYPNPFNPATVIEFSLPAEGPVRLDVFNVLGQKVATLVDEVKSAGTWKVRWNAANSSGRTLASGLYFYHLTAPGVMITKRMVLLK